MATIERKLRRFRMIEMRRGPGLGSVARLAFGPVATAMHILQRMASVARRRRPLVSLFGVTGRAPDLHVGRFERK